MDIKLGMIIKTGDSPYTGENVKVVKVNESGIKITNTGAHEVSAVHVDNGKWKATLPEGSSGWYAWEVNGAVDLSTLITIGFPDDRYYTKTEADDKYALAGHTHEAANIGGLVSTVTDVTIPIANINIDVLFRNVFSIAVNIHWTDTITGLVFYDVQHFFTAETQATEPADYQDSVINSPSYSRNLSFLLNHFDWGETDEGLPIKTKIWVRIRPRNISGVTGNWSDWKTAVSQHIPSLWEPEVIENLALRISAITKTADGSNIEVQK